MESIFYLVQNIPFQERQRFDFINLPGQVLSQNSGNISEHAVLAASLLLGWSQNQEPQPDSKKNPKPAPFSDRIFLCLGLNRKKKPIMWVMIICENFKDIEFWDIQRSKRYILECRIPLEARKTLQAYLTTKGIFYFFI